MDARAAKISAGHKRRWEDPEYAEQRRAVMRVAAAKPGAYASRTRPRDERFWEKVEKGPDCWLWVSTLTSGGYGNFFLSRREGNTVAHRWAYEQAVGPVPEGLDLDHLCRVRRCVNPAHLEPVTRQVNLRRGVQWLRAKVACPRGHPYDGRTRAGGRYCKQCKARLHREWLARHHSSRKGGGVKPAPRLNLKNV